MGKTMQYSGIIPYTVEALKVHDTTIAYLQSENARMQSENARMQSEHARMQSENARMQSENARMQAGNANLQREMGELRALVMAHSRILASSFEAQADGLPAQRLAATGTVTRASEAAE